MSRLPKAIQKAILLVRLIKEETREDYGDRKNLPDPHIGSAQAAIVRVTSKSMKINTPLFQSLLTPELLKLNQMFKERNFQLRMAGGVVRDLLMDIRPSDIDFASDATPSQIKEIFEDNQIRTFNASGEGHGTITCRIDDKENFEITTLRTDIVCDGRRAKVEYTTDWQMDANRRDLTVNSLFLELDGTVIDYFGGIEDIQKRRIVFVGDPVARIQEDFLRILRYFRFFGRISIPGSIPDEECICAIAANKDGLTGISGERIWSELKKICVGTLADEVMKVMFERCGLAPYLGLPAGVNLEQFAKIFRHNFARGLLPMTILSSLLGSQADLRVFHERCKLSGVELRLAKFLIEMREEALNKNTSPSYFKDLIIDLERTPGRDRKRMAGRELVVELAKYCLASSELISELVCWKVPVFPISGLDLMALEIPKGPYMGKILNHLFSFWKSGDCQATKEELILRVEEIKVNKAKLKL